MRWFRRKTRSTADEADHWEQQRARYLAQGRDLNAEFSRYCRRKFYQPLPTWFFVRELE